MKVDFFNNFGKEYRIRYMVLLMAILRWNVLSNFVYFDHASVEAGKIFFKEENVKTVVIGMTNFV
jgi:hypothetical protein